jgi:predicted AAA+ superfamily ATPase
MPKVYFYDLGLRNALIGNFSPIEARGDQGLLYENFIISEILKENYYGKFKYNMNFWRTKSGSEVDLVLGKNDSPDLVAVEIKLQQKRVNKAFIERYPNSRLVTITKDNFWV